MPKKTKIEPPVQLRLFDVLAHPSFERNLKTKIITLKITGDSQTREILKEYPKPEDLVILYLNLLARKVKLTARKRKIVLCVFEQLVKNTAIGIINNQKTNINDKAAKK